MYPFRRTALEVLTAARQPPLRLDGVHRSRVRVMPWDIDGFGELNNGRTLTLLDISRFGYFVRTGTLKAARREGWGLTVAGSSVRYRRRVRAFDPLTLHTSIAGRDARFFYMVQSLWRREEATGSALIRLAATGGWGTGARGTGGQGIKGRGIVPTARVLDALGMPDWAEPLPSWIAAWAEAEAARPWPPDGR